MGHFEIFRGIAKLNLQEFSIPHTEACQQLVLTLFTETKKEAVFHWPPVTLLARKPLSITV
jgi:hypothetical protein